MPKIIRDNDGDYAGGLIGTPQQLFCKAEGYNVATLGEFVGLHTHGESTITSTMIQSSLFVLVDGKGVCRNGDLAACGHSASPGCDFVLAD